MKKEALIAVLALIAIFVCQLVYAHPGRHPHGHNRHPKVVKRVVVVPAPAPVVIVNPAPAVVVVEKNVVAPSTSQEERIEQGIKSGELTKDEAAELKEGQKEIIDIKSEAASDGVITQKEKVEIEKKVNEENQEIYNEKHDAEKR